MTPPPKSENPKDRKVTSRFTAEELELLANEARRRGKPISSLVRDLVVGTIEQVRAKLEEPGQ